jgi:hypothetical protein
MTSLLFVFSAQAVQGQNLVLENEKIMSGKNKVGTYLVTSDTLKIVLFEDIDVDKLIPDMILAMKEDPKSINYISESSFTGKGSIRRVDVYIPSKKKFTPSSDRIQLSYNLGRHTDILSAKLKYFKSYGIEAAFATSLHRGDNKDHFLYLGLSSDFNLFYRSGWRGSFSAGPILQAKTGQNELLVSATTCTTFNKSLGKNSYFGPKLYLGLYNELALGLTIGL